MTASTLSPLANASSASRRSLGQEYDPGSVRTCRPMQRTARRCQFSAFSRDRVRQPCDCQMRKSVVAKSRPALDRMNSML